MATAIIMPRQGQSVESCIIAKWHKVKGDRVAEGDILFTYETDKATFDETSKVSGILLDVFFSEGDDVPCLINVCAIGEQGENVSGLNPGNSDANVADVASLNAIKREDGSAISSPVIGGTTGDRPLVERSLAAPISSTDDAFAVIMPRQGQSVESCIIGKWHKSVGDEVKAGDNLFTYETDKATFDEAAKEGGTLLAVFFDAGDDVPCLMNVCVIGKKGADVSVFDPRNSSSVQNPISSAVEVVTSVQSSNSLTGSSDYDNDLSGISSLGAISPRARNLARRHNADLRQAVPTGPKNRIIERDVLSLISEGKLATSAAGADFVLGVNGTGIGGRVSVNDVIAGNTIPDKKDIISEVKPEFYEEKHSNIRKIIARSMQESLSNMAQLTLNTSFDATDIIDLRAKLKRSKDTGIADSMGIDAATGIPTFNDIILYAVSRVLKNHRLCNAHFYSDKMVFFNKVNLGMAVDTPRGLMVPTIFGADKLSIKEISAQSRMLAAECQKGTISPDLIKGGTFTVTNLGTLGIESFTPVINPPQTCILGVNTLKTSVKDVDGKVVPYQSMNLSLTFDHRALDGAPAARFLKELKDVLENFTILLLK